MKHKLFSLLISILTLVISSQVSYAKTFAYMVGGEGEVAKLNTDSNAYEMLHLAVPEGVTLDKVLGADNIHNRLYLAHCIPLGTCTVGIYDLKSLKFIKELPIMSYSPDVRFVLYPDMSKFLIQYYIVDETSGTGGYTTDLYDAVTLAELKNLKTFFPMKDVMFSRDGGKMFSYIRGSSAKAYIVNSISLEIDDVKDLTTIWRKDVYSSGIKEGASSNGILVIYENLQEQEDDSRKLDLFTYDISSKEKSPKISTGLQGDVKIITNGSRLALNETKDIIGHSAEGESYLKGFENIGKLHVYEIATGKELVSFNFKPLGIGEILGSRPQGDRIYLRQETEDEIGKKSAITIFDIPTKTVMTTIEFPFRVYFLTFVED